jgi:hypothetical protein
MPYAASLAGSCKFIDLAVLPPGVTIVRDRHADDEEEIYLEASLLEQVAC